MKLRRAQFTIRQYLMVVVIVGILLGLERAAGWNLLQITCTCVLLLFALGPMVLASMNSDSKLPGRRTAAGRHRQKGRSANSTGG
jgi:hypothetical protein